MPSDPRLRRLVSALTWDMLGTLATLGAASCGLVMSFDGYDADDPSGRFAVKGIVDGLEGADATLTVNGAHPTLVGNGAFVINGAVADGADFTLTAVAPSHSCSVDHGTGRIAGADWTGAAVHCSSSDSSLTSFSLSAAPLVPAFDPARLSYDALLPWQEAQTAVTAATRSPRGRFAVNDGAPVPSGTPSPPLAVIGSFPLGVVAIAADGARSLHPYAVAVRRNDYLKASNTRLIGRGVNAGFGTGVALSGDGSTLAVGAPYELSGAKGINGAQSDTSATSSGAVYVFTRVGGAWTQQAYVKASNTQGGALFGYCLALSANGDRLAVGAYGETNPAMGVNGDESGTSAYPAGAVYVFSRALGTWSQEAYVKASNTTTQGAFGRFGTSVALSASGDMLAVGAPTETSQAIGINGDPNVGTQPYSGAVYLFRRVAAVWSQHAYLKASTSSGGLFGTAVAVSADGDTLAVGATGESSTSTGINGVQTPGPATNAGAAYIFVNGTSGWAQQAYLKASNTSANAAFGTSVTLSATGDTAAIGATGESSGATGIDSNQADTTAAGAGAVYVFSRAAGAWSQGAYVKASNTHTNAAFGNALALSGDAAELVIGSLREMSAATGVNGDSKDTSSVGAGAAYVFTHVGAWSQRAYLKASNTRPLSSMGSGVALTADGVTIATGAPGENSVAVGVNGDQNDSSAPQAGAVYVF